MGKDGVEWGSVGWGGWGVVDEKDTYSPPFPFLSLVHVHLSRIDSRKMKY